jgi:hypothetical protein
MVCRALGFAAVLLLVGGGWTRPVQAQENLDAGKSPSQLFSGNCSACHKSPRGLLKTVPAGSLPGFLRQHYTTGPDMAGVLSSYLIGNGASDVRNTGGQARGGKESRSEARSEAKPETEAAPAERAGRRHRAKSAGGAAGAGQAGPAPEVAPGTAVEPARAHRDGRKSTKHKHGKPVGDEAVKPNAVSEQPSEAAKPETGTIDAAKPASDEKPAAVNRPDPPRIEAPKASEPAPTSRAESASPVAPTTTQSVPAASPAGASDPSVPTAPSH